MQDPLNFLYLDGKNTAFKQSAWASLLKKCLERQTSVPQVSFHFSVGSAFFYKRRQILMTVSQRYVVYILQFMASMEPFLATQPTNCRSLLALLSWSWNYYVSISWGICWIPVRSYQGLFCTKLCIQDIQGK